MLAPFKSVNAGFYCAQKRMGDKDMLTCKANFTRGLVQRIMDQRVSKMNEGKVSRECHIINVFQQWEGREGGCGPGSSLLDHRKIFQGISGMHLEIACAPGD